VQKNPWHCVFQKIAMKEIAMKEIALKQIAMKGSQDMLWSKREMHDGATGLGVQKKADGWEVLDAGSMPPRAFHHNLGEPTHRC
jgi:hypothetical protein